MESYYCDDYEALTGKKPEPLEVVTKVIGVTDPQVETAAVTPDAVAAPETVDAVAPQVPTV